MQKETGYDPVFDAQEHFRFLLDAMARPGKINTLAPLPLDPPPGLSVTAALVAFALLDANTSFCVENGDAALTRYLARNTAARQTDIADADFVIAGGHASPAFLHSIKKGTLSYPDEGATLILDVEWLDTHSPGLPLTLSGPGIAGERTFFARGLDAGLPNALRACNAEFPLGVDGILADAAHHIVCIPRSSRLR